MATILSISNSATTGNSIGNNGGVYYRHAQSFITGKSWVISGADIWALRGAGTNNVPLLVRIETSSAGLPSGTLAHANASASIASFTDASLVQKTVTFTDFSLSDYTKYWLVLKTAESEGSGQYYRNKHEATNPYAEGSTSVATSGSWGAISLDDFQLNLLGTSSSTDANELYNKFLYNDANLAAYYRMNSGALTTDSKGSYTLTNANTVGETASGKFGYAADFGSANSTKHLEYLGAAGYTAWSQAHTMSTWVKRYSDISSGTETIFNRQVDPGAGGGLNYVQYEYNGGTRRIAYKRYDESTTETAYITSALGTEWHHIVFVYDGTNIVPYLDGVAGTPVASNGTSTGTSYGNAIKIGDAAGSLYWSGYQDDIAFFNRALTAAEVLQLYRLGSNALFFQQI